MPAATRSRDTRIPDEARARLADVGRRARRRLRGRLLAGRRHQCPCCGHGFRRLDDGPAGRPNSSCPRCGSLERQRALALFLNDWLPGAGVRSVLHIAPESAIRPLLEGAEVDYVAGDLNPLPGDKRIDIQALPFDDDSFDLVVCSHVLEHVPDDLAAMRELRRITRHEGAALLQHPVYFELAATVEDPGETDPAERTRRFGQHDHVRKYGTDFADRLAQAGFAFEQHSNRTLSDDLRERYRLVEPWESEGSGSDVYVCRPA